MLSNRTIVSGRISDRYDRKFEGPCREQWRNNVVTNYRRRIWECQTLVIAVGESDKMHSN